MTGTPQRDYIPLWSGSRSRCTNPALVRVFREHGAATNPKKTRGQANAGFIGVSPPVEETRSEATQRGGCLAEKWFNSAAFPPQSARCSRSASSISSMSGAETCPTLSPILSTETDRTCSAWAFESRSRPLDRACTRTWNAWTRSTFDVNGTTVNAPRPSRAAVELAPSFETITAGRLFAASPVLAASPAGPRPRSTSRMSPRSIRRGRRPLCVPKPRHCPSPPTPATHRRRRHRAWTL